MPRKPEINPKIINTNLKYRRWNPNEKSGIANEAIPVKATNIIKIGLTILAETAACPKTKAPTMPNSWTELHLELLSQLPLLTQKKFPL